MSLKNYNLLFISIIIVLSKWLSSTYFFDEPLSTKIIFESVPDGEAYYPQIKYLSKFLLNYSYDPEISNLRNIAIPISGFWFTQFCLKFLVFTHSSLLNGFVFLFFLSFFIKFLICFFQIIYQLFSQS